MAHRGPDARNETYLEDGGIFAGHYRLSLMAGPEGQQPYVDNRFLILLVGEIYNVADIAAKLDQPVASEVEAIARLLTHYGARGLDQLDGMYAIVAYDRQKRHVIVHRDPMGLKQLHVTTHRGRPVFASEIAPLLDIRATRGMPERDALIENFLFRVPLGRKTFYQGITRLRPGETVVLDQVGNQVDTWITDIGARCFGQRQDQADPKELWDVLQNAALSTVAHRDRGIADVPLLLSSGMDSNALGTIYGSRGIGISAVTASYPGISTAQDESSLATLAARHYGLPMRIVPVTASAEMLGGALSHLEAPTYSSSATAILAIAQQLADQGVKMVIVGDGSDELFFGYSQLMQPPDAPPDVYQSRIGLADIATSAALTGEPEAALRDRVMGALSGPDKTETWRQYQAFELRYRIPDYQAHRLDRLFMAHGIEARVPFLRRDVVQWALSVGRDLHLAAGRKSLLGLAVRPHVAPCVRDLAKKRFVAPVAKWRQGKLAADVSRHVSPRALMQIGLDPKLHKDDFAKLSDRCIWGIYMMARWAEVTWDMEPSL
ncbi:asparagine synthetase B family protein [Yoonia maricola]|nr:asparagine synthase-related protein [Yoonia maricola]